jgi:hypothetical protein
MFRKIPDKTVAQIQQSLDEARMALRNAMTAGESDMVVMGHVFQLMEAASWIVHQPPFLDHHKQWWSSRFGEGDNHEPPAE